MIKKGKSQNHKPVEKEKGFNVYFSGANQHLAFRINKKIKESEHVPRAGSRKNHLLQPVVTSEGIMSEALITKWKLPVTANLQSDCSSKDTFKNNSKLKLVNNESQTIKSNKINSIILKKESQIRQALTIKQKNSEVN